MRVDAEPRTVTKHVKRRGGPEMKEYWKDVEMPVLRPEEVPPEPESPLPLPGAEGVTKSKPLTRPKDIGNQPWQDEDG